MTVDIRPHRELTSVVATDLYHRIEAIEDKIRDRYPEAEFELLCGPDEYSFHLEVYTAEGDLWAPASLVDDEVDQILYDFGLVVFVIPLRLEDRPRKAVASSGGQ